MRAQIHVCTTCERIHDQKERKNGWNGWQQMKGKKEFKLQHKKIAKHPKNYDDSQTQITIYTVECSFFACWLGFVASLCFFRRIRYYYRATVFMQFKLSIEHCCFHCNQFHQKYTQFYYRKSNQKLISLLVNHGNHFNLFDYMPTANAE